MQTMLRPFALVSALLAGALAFASPAGAQESPPPVDDAARAAVVERLAELVSENYVFPEVGEEIAALLRAKQATGGYAGTTDAFALCELLTADLRSVNGDKHFAMRPVPPGAFDEEGEQDEAQVVEGLRMRNFGFRRVELLAGNVGYLDLRMFADAKHAGATAVAAMGFLANADALIFDLRQNGGGDPSMIQLLSSYLFEEPTHLNSFTWRGKEQIDQFWTLPHVPGSKSVDVPVYVLTSGFTGSAAEEFTYNLKNLERATIVGETTGGAANPGGLHEVGDGFAVFISSGRAINPITGTNWEGTGVEPHVAVPAPEALAVTHRDALRAIVADLPAGANRHEVEWALARIEADLDPPSVPVEALAGLAGDYGPRHIVLRDGQLHYHRDGGSETTLVPMATDLYGLAEIDFFRVRFERDAAGRVVRLIGLYEDGRRDVSPRDL